MGVAGAPPATAHCLHPPQVQLINDAYNAVVDAVLGAEAEAGEGREPCAAILATLKHVRIPIVSLDVPSGPAPRSAPAPGRIGPPLGCCTPHPMLVTLPTPGSAPREPPRCPPRVGTALGTPRSPPPEPGSVRAGSRSPRTRSGHPRQITNSLN